MALPDTVHYDPQKTETTHKKVALKVIDDLLNDPVTFFMALSNYQSHEMPQGGLAKFRRRLFAIRTDLARQRKDMWEDLLNAKTTVDHILYYRGRFMGDFPDAEEWGLHRNGVKKRAADPEESAAR